jgi:hypothetical protein
MPTFCYFFTEADQDRLQIQSQATKASAAKEKNNAKKRAAPKFRKCGEPLKGHPRGTCK